MAKGGKEKILAKAFLLFLEHGFKHVSIQNIQDDTMLSKGAIYYHFKSKYAIYQAAVEKYFLKIIDDFSKANDAHLDFKSRVLSRLGDLAKLFSLIEHIGTEKKAYAIRAFFVFQLESERDDTIRERTSQGLESYRSEMISVVQEGIDNGEVTVHLEANTIAHQLIAMAEGIEGVRWCLIAKGCRVDSSAVGV